MPDNTRVPLTEAAAALETARTTIDTVETRLSQVVGEVLGLLGYADTGVTTAEQRIAEVLAELDARENLNTSVSSNTITFQFDQAYPTGQYANGDPWAVGPVTLPTIAPESYQASGSYSSGKTYSNRWVHGTQVDPGSAKYAGSKARNKDNQLQGLHGIPTITNLNSVAYDHVLNVDPGATGVPLAIDEGTVYKFVSPDGTEGRRRPYDAQRPGGVAAAILTVVPSRPLPGALRPGVAAPSKQSFFTESDWDLSVFKSLPKVEGMPSFETIVNRLRSPWALQFTNTIGAPNVAPGDVNGDAGYPRDHAQVVCDAVAALHFDFTPAEKVAILNVLWPFAIDSHERAMEGGDPVSGGLRGGNGAAFRKPAMIACVAALRNATDTPERAAKLAEMQAMCDYKQNPVMPEDKFLYFIDQRYVEVGGDGSTADRRKDPYLQYMQGSYDIAPDFDPVMSGSNIDIPYRDICTINSIHGVAAAMLVEGGRALWNHEELWKYQNVYRSLDTWLNRWNGSLTAGEVIVPFRRRIAEALWPATPKDLAAPKPVIAKWRGDALWIIFDNTLREDVVLSPADFVVRINGEVVPAEIAPPPVGKHAGSWVSAFAGVFRSNVGLVVPVAEYGQTASVEYVGTALVSAVYQTPVQPFVVPVVNTAEPAAFTEPTATYPVVQFTGGARYATASDKRLADTDSMQGSLYLPNVRLSEAPSSIVTLFNSGGLQIELHPDRHMRIVLRNAANARIARIKSTALPLNTDNAMFFSWDMAEASVSTGVTVRRNGSPAGAGSLEWGTGQAVGWRRIAPVVLGGFNADFGGMWLDTTTRVTDPALFTDVTNGKLDIGLHGEGVTGQPPSLFLVGNADQYRGEFGFNWGSGPKFYPAPGGAGPIGGAWL